MTIKHNRIALAILLSGLATTAHSGVPVAELGDTEISFEGLVQADSNWYDSDVVDLDGDPGDGNDSDHGLRRAELILEGNGPGKLDWVIGYDANSEKWLDVNADYDFGNGHSLKVGQFKQPNSMEELSSTKNNDFISKAMTTNTFALSRRVGAAYSYGRDDLNLIASVFGPELTSGGDHGSGFGVRGTFAPINEEGRVLHVGASYIDRDTDADSLRLRTRPQADLAGVRLVDSGKLTDSDRVSTLGLEAFWVHGSFKLQGEVMRSEVDRYAGSNFSADGAYLSALWNVTGETWSYKSGTPGTAKPADPAHGMWQLGLRYDRVDMNDAGINGGRMDAITAGVNWYWQKNFKLMFNYVAVDSQRLGVSDNPNIVEARAQFYW